MLHRSDKMSDNTRHLLTNLPVEILEYIFQFCDIKTLTSIARTCKKLKTHADSEIIWKEKWRLTVSKYKLKLDTICLTGTRIYKDLCRRALLSCSPPNAGKNKFNCDCVEREVDSVIAYDVGSAMSWICWVGRFDKRGCPSMVAHLGHSTQGSYSKYRHEESKVDIDKLNQYLSSVGHPKISHRYIIGKDAKILSSMYPDLYRSDLYPMSRSQCLGKETKSQSLPDVLELPLDAVNAKERDTEDKEDSNFRRKSETAVVNSRLDFTPTSAETKQSALQNKLPLDIQGTWKDENRNHDCSPTAETVHSTAPKQEPFELHHVIVNGDINQINNFELILRHLFKQLTFGTHHYYHLHNTPMVILEPPNLSAESRDQLLHMMFQKLKVPRFSLYNKAMSLAPCLGLDTYLVVDSGAHSTVVTPVIDTKVQRHAVKFKPVGGYHISYRLADFVTDKGLIDEVLVDSFDSKVVKEECFLAYSPTTERQKRHSPRTVCVQKPGGLKARKETHKIDLGTERFLAPEDMYLHLGLPKMIQDAISACHQATHKSLLSRLILTGGNTQLTGFANRLSKDLKELMPKYADVIHVVHPSTNALSRALNAWTLHYKAAPLAYCKWITKEDYILHGSDVLQMKTNGIEKIADPCQHQA
ncbi:uncharacterized protein [Ptychodera flava]|uniref:uncharacterized protein n=1 Tax=Ptychodera flava TaxID=63121 RepID=UPI003969E74E